MKVRMALVVLVLVAAGFGVAAIVLEQGEPERTPKPFPTEQVVNACVEQLQSLPPFSGTDISPDGVCRCAVDDLVNRYSVNELDQMGEDAALNAAVGSLGRCRELAGI
jgi:hypothetical protein